MGRTQAATPASRAFSTVDGLRRWCAAAAGGPAIVLALADLALYPGRPPSTVLAICALLFLSWSYTRAYRVAVVRGGPAALETVAATILVFTLTHPLSAIGCICMPVMFAAFRSNRHPWGTWAIALANGLAGAGLAIHQLHRPMTLALWPVLVVPLCGVITHTLVSSLAEYRREYDRLNTLAFATTAIAGAASGEDARQVFMAAIGRLAEPHEVRVVGADATAEASGAITVPLGADERIVVVAAAPAQISEPALFMLASAYLLDAQRRLATEQAIAAQRDLHRQELERRDAQRLEALGRFAGGIAHDFSNVLASITAFSELLLDALPPDDPNRLDVAQIRSAAASGAELTGRLLAFARRQNVPLSQIDLDPALEGSRAMLSQLVPESIDLDIQIDCAGARVRAERSQIEQILMNLVLNARDACEQSAIRQISVSATRGAESGVVIEVRDTGCGMSTEVRARLFEPFFTTKARGKGTGLGLPTVHGIVAQLGGRIDVETSPGSGSVFTVHLPAEYPVSEPPPLSAPSERMHTPRGATILVVDDDEGVRYAVGRILGKAGYRAISASDGNEALRLIEANHRAFDLLLTDVVMPRMNGRELAANVRAIAPRIRIVMMSGHAFGELAEADGEVLPKPFAPDALRRRIARELRSGSGRRAPSLIEDTAPSVRTLHIANVSPGNQRSNPR